MKFICRALAGAVVFCHLPVVAELPSGATAAISFRAPEVIPAVKSVDYRPDVEVRLDEAQRLTVRCGDAAEIGRAHV